MLTPLILLLGSGPGAPAALPQEPATEATVPDTSRAPLLDRRRLQRAMTRLQSEHSGVVSLLKLGNSRDGATIEALRLAAGEATRGRPGILLVANIDGPLVYTSGLALDHALRLADGYGNDPRITRLLDTTTLYIVPRANPDGAEARFQSPLFERRATGTGADTDRDGVIGEDPPADVDGDGNVAWMRVPDPEGTWMADETDPRAMVEADRARGQRGIWKLVREGRDEDADGEAAEDAPLDAVVNANFAAGWEEHAPRAGLFPTDEPETRALCEFVLSREDLQLVVTYGELDNLVQAPKTVDDDAPDKTRVPAEGVRESDAARLAEIGRTFARVTGVKTEGEDAWAGSFQRWCYDHRGLTSLAIRPWALPLDAKPESADDSAPDASGAPGAGEPGDGRRADEKGDDKDEPEPSDDAKRLIWVDNRELAERHLGWTPFEHPELGEVEIGGFAPFATLEPPDEERAELADELFEFLLELGDSLARVQLSEATATDLGGGLLHIEAALVNEGYLPLVTTWGRRTRSVRPARVLLRLPSSAELIAGQQRDLVSELPGMGGRHELQWLVRGASAGTIGISVETDNAGSARAVPEELQ